MATPNREQDGDQLNIEDSNHLKSVLERFNEMREAGRGCDIIIRTEGKEISVHRNFMMFVSGYFEAMFSHDLKEKKSGIVEMEGIAYPILFKCIRYLYTSKISIHWNECESVLFAATLMQLTSLCNKIVAFLKNRLDVASFFDMKRIASKFDLECLHDACDEFALMHFQDLAKEEQFSLFEEEYLTLLLKSEKMNPSVTEDAKLASIIRWVKGDPEERHHHLLDLMNLLDLKRVSLEYGRFLAKNEKIFSGSAENLSLLFLGITDESTLPVRRHSDSNTILIFNSVSKYVEAYRPSDHSFSRIHPSILKMSDGCFACAVCGDFLYVLMRTKEVYRINYRDKRSSWVCLESMNHDHGMFISATVHDQYIYVAGDLIERYSVGVNEWETIRANNITCCRSTMIGYCGDIYILGGCSDRFLHDVNKLSPATLSWSPVEPMLYGRIAPVAAVHLEKIFVAGGSPKRKNEVEFFDKRSNSWSRISSMNLGRYGFGLCVANNKLFAIGSNNFRRDDPLTVEVYDDEKDNWTKILNKPEKKMMSAGVVAVRLPE